MKTRIFHSGLRGFKSGSAIDNGKCQSIRLWMKTLLAAFTFNSMSSVFQGFFLAWTLPGLRFYFSIKRRIDNGEFLNRVNKACTKSSVKVSGTGEVFQQKVIQFYICCLLSVLKHKRHRYFEAFFSLFGRWERNLRLQYPLPICTTSYLLKGTFPTKSLLVHSNLTKQ